MPVAQSEGGPHDYLHGKTHSKPYPFDPKVEFRDAKNHRLKNDGSSVGLPIAILEPTLSDNEYI